MSTQKFPVYLPFNALACVTAVSLAVNLALPAASDFFKGEDSHFTKQARANEQLEAGLAIKQIGRKVENGDAMIVRPVPKLDRDGKDPVNDSITKCVANTACYKAEANKLIESSARTHSDLTPNYGRLAALTFGPTLILMFAWFSVGHIVRQQIAVNEAYAARKNAPKA